jgi:hypothetical protein
MPNVPAPEECDTFQAYFRRRAEEETDAWTKYHYTGKAEVRIFVHPLKFFS